MTSRTKSSSQFSARVLRAPHRRFLLVAIALVAVLIPIVTIIPKSIPRVTGTLNQDVYVWQRSWSPPVQSAVQTRGGSFGELVVLVAEISWKNGEPKVARVKPDVASLKSASRPVGIAIRIGGFDAYKTIDPFNSTSEQTNFICDIAAASIERLKREGIK